MNLDLENTIRVYQVNADFTELCFKIDLYKILRKKDDNNVLEVSSIDFIFKAKAIFVTCLPIDIYIISS
jgi:hypothetical protein